MNQLPEVIALETAARASLTPGWLDKISNQLDGLTINSDVEAQQASSFLLEAVEEQKRIKDQTGKVKSKAHAVWKGICDLENDLIEPYRKIELKLRGTLAGWAMEKIRARRQQQEVVNKLTASDREGLQALAKEAAREGDIDRARLLRQEADLTAAPQLPPAVLNIPGVGLREEFEISIPDPVAFFRGIADGKIPTAAVTIDIPWLKKKARDLGGLSDYPGVEATPVKKIRVGR